MTVEAQLDPTEVDRRPISNVRRAEGALWIADLFFLDAPGDAPDAPARSQLVLLENGRPIGTAHAAHDEIRQIGLGRYSHWGKELWFSTSDNSDPLDNGRTYEVAIPRSPDRAPSPTVPCPEVDAADVDVAHAARLFREFDLLLVRNAVPVDRLSDVRRAAERIYAEQDRQFRDGSLADEMSYRCGFLFQDELKRQLGDEFRIERIAETPFLQDLLREIFSEKGVGDWSFFGGSFRRSTADLKPWSTHVNWHDDQYGVIDDGELVVVNCPLMATGRYSPGLRFVLIDRDEVKSYTRWDGSLEYQPGEFSQSNRFDAAVFDETRIQEAFAGRIAYPVTELGDVLVFSGWTIHGTNVVAGMKDWRMAVETRFKEVRETGSPPAD